MEKLPGGLVSTSGKVTAELDDMDVVDTGDIVQLWRAYSTNPSVHEGDMGFRLQNFFWRIWGSETLRNSIPGSRLATLFIRISEPGSVNSAQLTKTPTAPSPSSFKRDKPDSTHPSPLPPILKKSSTSSSHGETQKTTRLLLTDPGGQSVTRKPSNPPTPVPPARPPVLGGDLSNRQSQKKTFVVASKAKGAKRRPVVMRRKSSQQSSVASSTQCSTRAQSPQPDPCPIKEAPVVKVPAVPTVQESNSSATKEEPKEPKPAPFYRESDPEQTEPPLTFLSDLKGLLNKKAPTPPTGSKFPPPPSLSYFSVVDNRSFDVRHLSEENYEQPSTSSLVDKNFRTRFVEQKRQEGLYLQASAASSLRNEFLSAPGPGPGLGPFSTESTLSTRTNDTTSPSRFGDSHDETSTIATSIPLSNGLSATATTDTFSSSSNAIPSSSGGGALFLNSPLASPRGPSQLSLLLGQSHNESGSQNAM